MGSAAAPPIQPPDPDATVLLREQAWIRRAAAGALVARQEVVLADRCRRTISWLRPIGECVPERNWRPQMWMLRVLTHIPLVGQQRSFGSPRSAHLDRCDSSSGWPALRPGLAANLQLEISSQSRRLSTSASPVSLSQERAAWSSGRRASIRTAASSDAPSSDGRGNLQALC